jgi:hypothetical protein
VKNKIKISAHTYKYPGEYLKNCIKLPYLTAKPSLIKDNNPIRNGVSEDPGKSIVTST